jgi:uncharacterized membrane protein
VTTTTIAVKPGWPVAAALVVLSAIPLTAGTLRVVQLSGGPAAIPPDDRSTAFPLPVLVHILAAVVFALAGTLQFIPRLRCRGRSWHRRAGCVVALAGLLVAGSGVWMTLLYAPKPGTGAVLYVMRLLLGSAMTGCLILGIAAIRRRDIGAHRAWMIRAYGNLIVAEWAIRRDRRRQSRRVPVVGRPRAVS